MLGMADKLRFPPKSDRNLGPHKEVWCEFHKVFGHDMEHCIALGYQLGSLIKDGFLKEYLEGSQEESKEELPLVDQGQRYLSTTRLILFQEEFQVGDDVSWYMKRHFQELDQDSITIQELTQDNTRTKDLK